MSSMHYSEVYAVLNMLGKSYVSKIPLEIIIDIENKMDKDYMLEYDINDVEFNNNISDETMEFIANLNLNYWNIY